MNKFDRLSLRIDKLEKKLNDEVSGEVISDEFTLIDLIDRYSDDLIKNAFKSMYPNVSAKIEDLKHKKITVEKSEIEIKKLKAEIEKEKAFDELINNAFLELYPTLDEKMQAEIERQENLIDGGVKVDNENFNKYIRGKAGFLPVKENNDKDKSNDKDIIIPEGMPVDEIENLLDNKQDKQGKKDMNDLFRQKFRNDTIKIRKIFERGNGNEKL